MKNQRNILLKYGITLLTGFLIAFFYIRSKDIGSLSEVERYRVLSDAFTIPGMLMLCVGLLLWASTTGIFDGVVYAAVVGLRMLIPVAGLKRWPKYYDFVQDQREKRVTGWEFIPLCGLFFLLITAVFMVLFYRLY